MSDLHHCYHCCYCCCLFDLAFAIGLHYHDLDTFQSVGTFGCIQGISSDMLDTGNAMRFCVLVLPALHGISIIKYNRVYAVCIVGMCTIIKPQELNQFPDPNVVLLITSLNTIQFYYQCTLAAIRNALEKRCMYVFCEKVIP